MKVCASHDGFGNFKFLDQDETIDASRDEEGMRMMLAQTLQGFGQALINLASQSRLGLGNFRICIESDFLNPDAQGDLVLELTLAKPVEGAQALLDKAVKYCFPYSCRPVRQILNILNQGDGE